MSCEVIAADCIAERYLLGQLNELEQAAFERHCFDCERCFGELQTLEAMRAAGYQFSDLSPGEYF